MRYIVFLFIFSVLVISCKKYADTDAVSYAGQDSLYCNDPEAINYNHNFPGTANNNICLFPTDVFKGRFILQDSIFTADFASFYTVTDTIDIYALSKTKMAVVGFCGPFDSIKLTANRYYKATIDSIITNEIIMVNGQYLCNAKDTINGTFANDSNRIRVNFTLMSDTAGTKYHKGTAIRIQ